MTEELIIKKYNLGPQQRVKFKHDDRTYYVKSISPDRKNVFLTSESGIGTWRKAIKNIINIDGKNIQVNVIKKSIKEEINKKQKLFKQIYRLENINTVEISELFGYDLNTSHNLLVEFLNNTISINGDLTIDKDMTDLGIVEEIIGDLDIEECTKITNLGNIIKIRGSLLAGGSGLKTLSNLFVVHLSVELDGCKYLKNFGKLKHVGGDMFIRKTKLGNLDEKQLRRMVTVEGDIVNDKFDSEIYDYDDQELT